MSVIAPFHELAVHVRVGIRRAVGRDEQLRALKIRRVDRHELDLARPLAELRRLWPPEPLPVPSPRAGNGASGGQGSRRRARHAPAFCACWPARPPRHTPPLRARRNGWHPSGRRADSRRTRRSNRHAGAWPCRSRCRWRPRGRPSRTRRSRCTFLRQCG